MNVMRNFAQMQAHFYAATAQPVAAILAAMDDAPNSAVDQRLLCDWLLHVLDETGLKPTELARRAGVAPSTINKPVRGCREGDYVSWTLSTRTITKIARATGMQAPNLATGQVVVNGQRVVNVPVITWAQAGNPGVVHRPIEQLDIDGYIPVPSPPPMALGVTIRGNSINRRKAHDGMVAVFDADDTDPLDNKVYLIVHDGEPRLRVYRSSPARFEPDSTEAEHETLFPNESTRILGRVFFVGGYL